MDRAASFADLDRRARAGETLTVVFFGCSLTWGANSTDPDLRSMRGCLAERLRAQYPSAHWRFVDAAIGGTNSLLGIFRFERDVARHRPDLVVVDFTLNDGAEEADGDRLASYEAIVRGCVEDLRAPVVQALLCARAMVACLDLARFRTRTAHLAIADAYATAVGDAFALMQDRLRAGRLDLDAAWDLPADDCHPGDLGYELYAEAAWQGLSVALREGRVCRVPARRLHAATYRETVRARLATITPLPDGWRPALPTRIAAWHDSLMSRWLDGEVLATRADGAPLPAAWELRFRGASALLYGESTISSGRLRVVIDGRPAPAFPDGLLDCRSAAGGTVKLAVALAVGLDPNREHHLRLEPLVDGTSAAEWRIESLCVAGEGARVWR
ncbi:MAG: hypothetical protein H0W72_01535 [Planctomycetes bacterium]|nr:hypothetical protein [Planctomycetota bacterium]